MCTYHAIKLNKNKKYSITSKYNNDELQVIESNTWIDHDGDISDVDGVMMSCSCIVVITLWM